MAAIIAVFNELKHIPAVHFMSDRTVISLLLSGNSYTRSGFLIVEVSFFKIYMVIIPVYTCIDFFASLIKQIIICIILF